jgi:xanthine dehydrogenase molybdopterin-binding subunit B
MIDTHTGESCVLCANIIYDSGISLNPAIDIGQCEGGFVQGIGFNTTEELTYDQTTGAFTSINTWLYKPPSTLEIPLQLNIRLWPLAGQVRAWQEEEKKLSGGEDAPSTGLATRLALPSKDNKFRKHWMRIDPSGNLIDPYGVQSSKASGEPPLVLGNAVWYAIRAAVQYARWQRYTAAGRGVTLYQTDAELLCPATTFNTFAAINAPLLSDEELAAYHAGTLSDDKQQRKKLRVPDIEHDPFVMAHIPQPPGGGLASVVPAPSVEHKK